MGNASIKNKEVIGFIPAAGNATRISPLPCSKEIFPIGFIKDESGKSNRPKAICEYLLERMRQSGANTVYFALRDGKWDIPSYLGNGTSLDMHIAYLLTELPFGVPYTIDNAFPFIKEKLVVFGFPDIIFQPEDAFVQLIEKQFSSNADIVLGLFPASNPQKVDMVDLDDTRKIRGLQIKPTQTDLKFTWIIAAWVHAFTQFLHDFIANHQTKMIKNNSVPNCNKTAELYFGEVIQAALNAELKVEKVIFDQGRYVDIGTSEDLAKAVQNYSSL